MAPCVGSSPLARGLLAYRPANNPQAGIIPARAGFTTSPTTTPPGKEDHPRSRGVYREGIRVDQADTGSSPLARGLQTGLTRCTASARIIPARAGVTAVAAPYWGCSGGHSRSRGVYCCCCPILALFWGSSPLARGLRDMSDYYDFGRRIIPARAGFTPNFISILCTARDHPRSRGVYLRTHRNIIIAWGSYPLARGLHVEGQARPVGLGIIPARAGFTFAPSPTATP